MRNLARLISLIAHPVLVPVWAFLIFAVLLNQTETLGTILMLVWLIFGTILIPTFYFIKGKSIKLEHTTVDDRVAIYRAYIFVYFGMVIVSYFLAPIKTAVMNVGSLEIAVGERFSILIDFFWALVLLHAVLFYLAKIKLKASWHAAVWAFFILYLFSLFSSTGFPVFINYTLASAAILVLALGSRAYLKAHTSIELLVGTMVGAIIGGCFYLLSNI